MEELILHDKEGTKIYADSMSIGIELGVIGDVVAVVLSKEQAKQLGEWLIKAADGR
jgi:hypothetical protein